MECRKAGRVSGPKDIPIETGLTIGGIHRTSLIDYPGLIATVIFLRGCNFRCPYCFNPELIDPERYSEPVSKDEVLHFLAQRKGKIDGVVITGGEPTLNSGLYDLVKEIRSLKLRIKIDTNGSRPDVIEQGLADGLIDFLAVDLKGPLKRYNQICGTVVDTDLIQESIQITLNSGIDYEFRTTMVPGMIAGDDLYQMSELIRGAECWVLQNYVPSKTLDPSFMDKQPYDDEEMERFKSRIRGQVKKVIVR
jgi:pyruvate formate lyase activating enzyme